MTSPGTSETAETGSPQPLQPEVIPLPSTPTTPERLRIPKSPSSPARPTHASTPSSSSASTASSSSKPRSIQQHPPLPSSPQTSSLLLSQQQQQQQQLSAIASVAPFAHPSELPSIAARRANSGVMKSGRELLLPIGVGSRPSEMGSNSTSNSNPTSPTSPSRMRTSLDRILRREGAASTTELSPGSPASGSMRFGPVSPRQARFAQTNMDGYNGGGSGGGNGNEGSIPPRSPRSVRSQRSTHSLMPPSPARSAFAAAMAAPSPASPTRSEHFPPSPQSPGAGAGAAPPINPLASQPSTTSLALKAPWRQTPSKHPFSPHPPPDAHPFVPHVSEKTGKPERNFETHPSKNRFFLRGRILTGGDTSVPFILSFALVLGIAGTWFGTTAVWWWHNESPAVAIVGAYLCLLTISSMLATALRDPGILPRDLDPDPPYPATSPSDGAPKLPLPREIRIRDGIIRTKYCVTCKTYRSPRASHCKTCDNCVDGCDHHCQWVNNCVGRRNYTSFITFIVVANLTLALVIVTAAIHLLNVTRQDHVSFGRALHLGAGSAVVFALGIVVIWPLLSLLGYHIRLLFLNITTIEQLRNKYERQISEGPPQPMYNPFSYGKWYRNVAYLLCRPSGFTWLEASGVKMDDRREINPGAYEDWEFVDREETASMRRV